MSELAAHLVDRVLPRVPIRQWVFTVPVLVRYQLAFDAVLTRSVLRVFLRTVFSWQRRRAARRGLVGGRSGSITAIQRFGGSANLNVHFHALLFDGVYTRATPTARPVFHRLPPPTDADIAVLLARVQRRVRGLLSRRGRWPDAEAGSDPFAVQEPLFASAVAASLQGRVALGLRAGQPVRRLRSAAAVTATGRRSARLDPGGGDGTARGATAPRGARARRRAAARAAGLGRLTPLRKAPTTGRRCPRLSAACSAARGSLRAPCADPGTPLPGRSAVS